VTNIPKHPDSYGLKTQDCLSILTAVVLEPSSFAKALPARVHACARVCACVCVLLSVRVSDSLTLSFDSNVLWRGKCLGFGFPGSRAMADKLLLPLHSPSPSPKASLDPGMLCWGWQDFLTDDQKEQLCLLPWLCSLLPLRFLRSMSRCSPGGDMTLFAASKDVRITPTSAVPHAHSLPPRQLESNHTRVHNPTPRHKHALGLGPPSSTPMLTHRISINPPSLYAETRMHKRSNTGTRRQPQRYSSCCGLHPSEPTERLKPLGPHRAAAQIP